MSHDALAAALGLLAGILSAVFGVGGGVVFVPTLIFLGASARVAVATSLAAMVPVVLMGSWRQTTYGSVTWRDATVIGVASVPTAKLGELVADSLPNDTLKRLFAVVLLITAVQLAARAFREPPAGDSPLNNRHGEIESRPTRLDC